MRSCRVRPPAEQYGFLLVEAAAAVVLTATLMTLAVQALGMIFRADRTSHQRQLALGEAANVMERLAALDADKLNDAAVANWKLSGTAREQLPAGRLVVRIEALKSSMIRKTSVAVDWNDSAGRRVIPVRLTAWLNPQRSSSP